MSLAYLCSRTRRCCGCGGGSLPCRSAYLRCCDGRERVLLSWWRRVTNEDCCGGCGEGDEAGWKSDFCVMRAKSFGKSRRTTLSPVRPHRIQHRFLQLPSHHHFSPPPAPLPPSLLSEVCITRAHVPFRLPRRCARRPPRRRHRSASDRAEEPFLVLAHLSGTFTLDGSEG
jgi:hypothetical protein